MNYDDMPVGTYKKKSVSNDQLDESDNTGLSEEEATIEARILSKSWKKRLEAFSELKKDFEEAEPLSTELISKHTPSFGKYIGDSHPGVQKKVLEALMIVIERNPPVLGAFLFDIASSILKLSSKPVRIEIGIALGGKANLRIPLMNSLLDQISGKNPPKTTAAALEVITALLNKFGNSVFPIKDTIPIVEKHGALSTNSAIRTEAMNYYKECFNWIGEEIMKYAKNLKSVQQEELAKAVGLSTKPPTEVKPLIEIKPSEEKKTTSAPLEEEKKDIQMSSKPTLPTLPSPTEEYDVLGDFKETWCSEILTIKKWNEKVTKLDELIQATSVPKIKNDNISELVSCLSKLLNDANQVVANYALKAIGNLAEGLRGNFSQYHKGFFHYITQRFKDKKTHLEADKCLEKLSQSVNIEEMMEELKDELSDRSPAIRMHICQWLQNQILPRATNSTVKAMTTSGLTAMLSTLTDDINADIRDAALSCLSKMKTSANKDNPVHKMIEELNQAKKEKIEKIYQETETIKRSLESGISEIVPPPEVSSSYPGNSKLVQPDAEKIKRPITAKKADPSKDKQGEDAPGEDNETIIVEKIGEKIIEEINKSEWKERQKGFQDLNLWLASNTKLAETILIPLTSWVKYKLKDFKESNQTILKEAFLVIAFLATLPNAGKKFASLVVPGIIERMADSKWTETCSSILLNISDASTPSYVVLKLIDKINANLKNQNLVKVSLGLLNKLLDEYSPKMIPIKEMVTCCKELLGNSNQSIRTNATKTLAQIYSYVGETLKMFLTDVKDVTRKSLEAEFANVKVKEDVHSLVEKRTLRGEAALKQSSDKEESKASNHTIIDSLLPRVNVTEQLNAKILSGLSAPDRKLREEAKEQIEKVLLKAKYRINPNGHTTLMNVLKDRMFEPCKSLAKDFIKLISTLVCAMGPGCKQYSKIILPALMGNLGDKQNYIRAEATDAMNKFAEQAGPECLISSAGGLLEKDNPELRSGLLSWMLENAQAFSRSECISLVHGLVRCLQDKSKEIRSMAEKIVEIVMPLVGSQHFHADILDLKPTNRDFVKLILDKYSPGTGSELVSPTSAQDGDKTPRELKHSQKKINQETSKTSSGKKTVAKTTPKEVRKIIKEVPEFRKSMAPIRRKTETKKLKNSGSGGIEPLLLEDQVLHSSPSSLKQKRLVQEKGQKWPIVEMKPELLEKLKKILRPHISPSLHDLMFSGNPKKVGEAITILSSTIANNSNVASVLNILDLILKWVTAVIMDQNLNSLYKPVIDFLNSLFTLFVHSKYLMNDSESAILMPVIIERSGISNPSMREQIKQFILEAYRAIPVNKVCNYLVRGLDSRSQITKVACLELIRSMIAKFGISVITARDIKSFGRMMDVSVGGTVDPALRVECGNLLAEVYKHKGEAIWSNLGDIPDKVKAPLQERFKHVSPIKPKNTQKKYFKMPAVVPLSAMELPAITNHEDPITEIEIKMDLNDVPTLPEDIEHIPENEVMSEEEKEAVGIHTLDDCIISLQGTDINEKVVALVFLNELVDNHSESLHEYVDSLLETVANIVDEIFMNKPADIPIKFTKFFLFSLMKFTGKVVEGASSAHMELLMEQLLRNILYPGIDTLEGPNKEDNIIYKSLNDSMVNLINKCQPDRVYKALLHLYSKFQIHKEQSKLPDLIVKCILKLTKNLAKIHSKMDIEAVLLNFHEFLISSNSEDETGPKLIKTIVNELIKIKKHSFWQYYNKVDMHPTKDIYIKRWATLMLKSQKAFPLPSRYQLVPTEILEGLKQRETYEESIAGLAGVLFQHPDITLEDALEGFETELQQEISLSINLYLSSGAEGRLVATKSQNLSHQEERQNEGKKAHDTEDIPKPKNLEGSIPKLVRGGTMRERKLPQGFYQSRPNETKPSLQ